MAPDSLRILEEGVGEPRNTLASQTGAEAHATTQSVARLLTSCAPLQLSEIHYTAAFLVKGNHWLAEKQLRRV